MTLSSFGSLRRRRKQLRKSAERSCSRRGLLELLERRDLFCGDFSQESSASSLLAHADTDTTLADEVANGIPTQPADSVGILSGMISSFSTLANGIPILHSRPSAPTAIYLDFDGDATASMLPYNEDSDSTTFNSSEQATIVEAWRETSLYFAPFDIDVTTIQPSAGTPTAWAAASNSVTGRDYSGIGVFPNSYARSYVSANSARTRGSAFAHELGHNFGLQHQSDYDLVGVKTAEYSSGYDALHGPIMGVDYAQSVHKWFLGHATPSPSTLQNDVTIIANKIKPYQGAGGDGFRPDDFGNTIAAATPLTNSGSMQVAAGVIERLTDVDAFSFTSNGSPLIVSALPDTPSALDAKLEIYDSAGTLIAAKDGSTNLQSIPLTLPAGTYYALVSSHGNFGDMGA